MNELRTFGTLGLHASDGRELASVLAQPKRVALLLFLAAARPRGFQRRDKIIALLWPEHDQAKGRQLLNKAVHHLRRALGDASIVSRGDEELALDDRAIHCDVRLFEDAIGVGAHARAWELYRGELADGLFVDDAPEFDRWLSVERARLRTAASSSALALADAADRASRFEDAVEWVRRSSGLLPDDEPLVRRLMIACDRAGDRAGALRAYGDLSAHLARELEVSPSRETTLLAEALRRDDAVEAPTISAPRTEVRLPTLAPAPVAAPVAAQVAAAAVAAVEGPKRPSTLLDRGSRLLRVGGMAATLLVVLGIYSFNGGFKRGVPSSADEPRTLAVLPFANVGGDSAQDYLADGMSDELATALAKMPGIRLVARSSSYRYRGRRDVDVREAGHALGARLLLQGTVRRAGSHLVVSAQLTGTADGTELWSEMFERGDADIFAVQDDIRRSVADALKLQVGRTSTVEPRNVFAGTTDQQAYDLYLRGRFLVRRRGTGVRLAADDFEKAIARDTGFARAYAALAATLELFPFFAKVPADSVYGRATAAARHALALDSTLGEAHAALGMAHMHAFHWDSAGTELRRAIALDSNDAASHQQYGRFLVYTGDDRAAIPELVRARHLDPTSALVSAWVTGQLARQGRVDEAVLESKRALELDSTNSNALMAAAEVALRAGQPANARAFADRLPAAPPFPGIAAWFYAQTGDRTRAMRVIAEFAQQRQHPWFSRTQLAYAYLSVGNKNAALDALTSATDAHEIWPAYKTANHRMFNLVRRDPRFAALLRRVGLDPALFTTSSLPGGVPR